MAFKNHFFHRIQTIHFFFFLFQLVFNLPQKFTRLERKRRMNEEKKNKIEHERRRKKRDKKKVDAFLDPAVVTKIGADDSLGSWGIARGATHRWRWRGRCNRRHSPPEAGGSSHAPPASRSRVPQLERADSFESSLSLNRDLQPAPRWTAAWTIRDLFTAETVSSNRSSRLLNARPRLGLFHATWIR